MARIPKVIRVTNFERYQHGGEETKYLPWVKLYVATLTDIDLMALPTPTFKVFICLLLLARRSNNRVTVGGQNGCKKLAQTMHLTSGVVTGAIQELLREGLIEPFRVETQSSLDIDEVDSSRARGRSSPSIPASGSKAQALVAHYVDHADSLGLDLPRQMKGATARQVGALLKEGKDERWIRRAVELLNEKGLNPASLGSLYVEAQREGKRRGEFVPTAELIRLDEARQH